MSINRVEGEHAATQRQYTSLAIEPITIMREDFSKDEYIGFLKGNILKYLLRNKGDDIQDAAKIVQYAQWLKTELEENANEERKN